MVSDARAIPGSKQLLRVGATPPGTSEFTRRGELHIQHAVGRNGSPITAASGLYLYLVEHVFDPHGTLLACS